MRNDKFPKWPPAEVWHASNSVLFSLSFVRRHFYSCVIVYHDKCVPRHIHQTKIINGFMCNSGRDHCSPTFPFWLFCAIASAQDLITTDQKRATGKINVNAWTWTHLKSVLVIGRPGKTIWYARVQFMPQSFGRLHQGRLRKTRQEKWKREKMNLCVRKKKSVARVKMNGYWVRRQLEPFPFPSYFYEWSHIFQILIARNVTCATACWCVWWQCRPMSAIQSSFVSLIIIIVPVGCVPNMITDRPTEQRRVLKFLFCINNSFRFPSCLTPRRIVLNAMFFFCCRWLSLESKYITMCGA